LQAKGYAPVEAQWHCSEVAEYLAWRRVQVEELGEADFLVEYPEDDSACFQNTGRPVIRAEYLKPTCSPQGPQEGHSYLISADVGLGLAHGDPSAIEVLDLDTGRQVHSEDLRLPPDLLAHRLVELSDLYNGALIVVERNGPGIATVRKLLELVEPERVYRHLDARLKRAIEDGRLTADEAWEQAQYGLPTTNTAGAGGMKAEMGLLLERAVRTGEIGLSSQEWCEQAKTVVWLDSGKWAALPGYHDDKFIALAIGNYVRVVTLGEFLAFVGVLPETGYAR
jgi:hypothetical protein